MSSPGVGPAILPGPLVLSPKSARSRRRWVVTPEGAPTRHGDIVLPVARSTQTFASLEDVWRVLADSFLARRTSDLQRFRKYVESSRTAKGSSSAGLTLALSRRISRESGPATRAVELGSQLLIEGLAESFHGSRIHIPHVDELDSLSLRLLARAVVLLTDAHRVELVFSSDSDPRAVPVVNDLAESSRVLLLRNVVRYGEFDLSVANPPALRSRRRATADTRMAEAELMAHNYESALLRCSRSIEVGDDAPEALRLSALAAVNLGRLDDSMLLLSQALELSGDVCFRAHLRCLLALVTTKRRHDLAASEDYIDAGLEELAILSGGHEGDVDLERAWLLNARALNTALEYRRSGGVELFRRAHALEVEASRLVATGSSDERSYLRMNVLANTAFLWDMAGRPDVAIRVFEQVFARRVSTDPVAQATLRYRLAVLHFRAKEYARADELLRNAVEGLPSEEWPLVEHVLRARTRITMATAQLNEAETLARQGLELGLRVRARDCVIAHGVQLRSILHSTGRTALAAGIAEMLETEGISPEELVSATGLRPKLPAYIPEIDLEDVPLFDTNSRLAAR